MSWQKQKQKTKTKTKKSCTTADLGVKTLRVKTLWGQNPIFFQKNLSPSAGLPRLRFYLSLHPSVGFFYSASNDTKFDP
jgi:hypothetical protein